MLQLRADVHVQTLGVAQRLERRQRVVGRQPELRAVVRRLHRLVRVGLDARRDADQEARRAERLGTLELLERVEHDQRAGGGRTEQQVVLFVVPVHDQALSRNTGSFGELELARGRNVGTESLLGEQA